MKTKETTKGAPTETVCDLYAQVIWLREEVGRLERPTLRVSADGQASKPKHLSIVVAVKDAVEGG